MTDSILDSTKNVLGVPADYDVFDPAITMHINSALSRLDELGVGPTGGFSIEGSEETWVDLLGVDPRLNNVKQFVYLSVRMVFDPPGTSYLVTSIENQIQKLEWLINAHRESVTYIPSAVEVDGGSAVVVE